MAKPIQQTISCPQCGQPFSAILEQVLDVGIDPTVKERLLSGRVNSIACPQCGYRGMVGTPLMYHDPEKQLAITYVPMELNLTQEDREGLIGEMTKAVMNALSDDAPKGYLLQPVMALTFQGLLDQVLEADGITREMLDNERKKIELVEQLATAPSGEVENLLQENEELIDLTFMELLRAAAQNMTQAGDTRASLRLLNLRTRLMDETEVGQELKAQEEALVEASMELQALGEDITRESFVDLMIKSADNKIKIGAFATLGRALLDYTTFQLITDHIDTLPDGEEKDNLQEMREMLLAAAAEYERQSRVVVERAVDTLKMLLQAGDIKAAIQSNIDRIDEAFLSVLQANLEEARRTGNVEVSSLLTRIQEEVMALVQASAPPEIQFINELLSAGSEAESFELLGSRSSEVTPELLEIMEGLSGQLRDAGNEPVADRLDAIRNVAAQLLES